jgi:C-terminal processing protease CtpA/Prc
MRKWLLVAFLLAAVGLLQGCGGSSPDEPAALADAACSVDQQRAQLRSYMQDHYYWYQQLRTPDESATSMDAYFQSMLYRPTDRFSFTETTAAHNQVFVDGRRTGYGYSLVWADAQQTQLRVRFVEPRSPVARGGLKRGDVVTSIDGFGPQEIAAGALAPVTTPGVPRHFELAGAGAIPRTLDVLSEDYPLTPLANTATFDITRNGAPVKVGYLNYTQFVGYSEGDLSLAFIRFGQAGIGELILDLRYNGGGSVATSRNLASMIGGDPTAGKLFAYLRFNDKQGNMTTRVQFNTEADAFAIPIPAGLKRVVVLTSENTASASELLINGLKPFVDVVLVGETTYGKPYGFVPRDICGTTYDAVEFESLNALGVGGFTSGFTPDCAVPDDLDHAQGDANEARTRAALNYLSSGSCGLPQAARAAKAKPAPGVFGETTPAGMYR